MLFNSYIFILLFLPLCLIGYFALNALGKSRLALAFLLIMSLWFYGTNAPVYLLLILGSVAVNFSFYMLSKKLTDTKSRKLAKIAAVAVNLGVLFYFKYYDFFITTVNSLFSSDWNLRHILLPLGISFFTFQQISFVVDAFNGEVPDYDFLDYSCFVTFFPQLVAGPIVTHDELVPQFKDESRKHFSWDSFFIGFSTFSLGLAKKVLIADSLSRNVIAGYIFINGSDWETMNSTACVILMLSYTLQIYFDFSGYSDMAVGIGRMFNIDLPQNFNAPYKALSMTDFWRRWHMTLTGFFRRYVYFPLGGSRKGMRRTYLNILIVFFLSGLWHGAAWTFVLWGVLHGLGQIIHRLFSGFFDRLPKFVGWFLTFLYVNLCFVFFRAPDISQALVIIRRIFSFDFGFLSPVYAACFDLSEVHSLVGAIPFLGGILANPVVFMLLFLAFCMFLVLVPKNAYERMNTFRPSIVNIVIPAVLLIWCIFSFGRISEFLYFNF